MSSTFYSLLEFTNNSYEADPPGYLGSWGGTLNAGNAGVGATQLCLGPSSVQQTLTCVSTAFTAATSYALAQFMSQPLAGQSAVSAGNWVIAFALNTNVAFNITPAVGVFLVDSTGALKTTIIAAGTACGAVRANTAARTCFSTTVAGSTFTPAAGDRIVAELGFTASTSSTYTVTLATSGGTTISSDNVATGASARSRVLCPTTLVFSTTTLYMRAGITTTMATPPAGYLVSAHSLNPGKAGAGASVLSLLPGSSQLGTDLGGSQVIGTVGNYGFNQFISDPLAGQVTFGYIGLGGFGVSLATAASFVTAFLSLAVIKADGTLRAAVNTSFVPSNTLTAPQAEITSWNAGTGNSGQLTVFAGDRLVLEYGIAIGTTGTYDMTMYDSGATAIVANAATTSDAKSFITLPVALQFLTSWQQLIEPESYYPRDLRSPWEVAGY